MRADIADILNFIAFVCGIRLGLFATRAAIACLVIWITERSRR